MEYITSRKLTLPESEMNDRWGFNMWKSRLWPFEALKVGDILYWYETPKKRIAWKTEVVEIDKFPYKNKKAASNHLNATLDSFDGGESYFVNAPEQGFCLAYKVTPLQKLNLTKPYAFRFPQQGWLRGDQAPREWLARTQGGVRPASLIRKAEEEIERSAGFQSNSKIRRAVELQAMDRTVKEFRNRGYDVKDISKKSPYDLLCSKADVKKYVEVKGTQGRGLEIILTAGEVRFIRENKANCVLCVVHEIKISSKRRPKAAGGSLKLIEPFDIAEGMLKPLAYTFRPKA